MVNHERSELDIARVACKEDCHIVLAASKEWPFILQRNIPDCCFLLDGILTHF